MATSEDVKNLLSSSIEANSAISELSENSTALQTAWNNFSDTLNSENLQDLISTDLSGILDGPGEFLENIGDQINDLLGEPFKILSDGLEDIKTSVEDALNASVEEIIEKVKVPGELIEKLLGIDLPLDIFSDITSNISKLKNVTNIMGSCSDVLEALSEGRVLTALSRTNSALSNLNSNLHSSGLADYVSLVNTYTNKYNYYTSQLNDILNTSFLNSDGTLNTSAFVGTLSSILPDVADRLDAATKLFNIFSKDMNKLKVLKNADAWCGECQVDNSVEFEKY